MTKSELELRGHKSKENIAALDRAQRDKESLRALGGSIYGSSTKMVGDLVKGINDKKWYLKVPGTEQANLNIATLEVSNIEDFSLYNMSNQDHKYGNPAVFSVTYIPMIGQGVRRVYDSGVASGTSVSAPINRALNRVATQLEKRNSRALSYSRDTIGRYWIAATNIATDLLRLKAVIDVYDRYSGKFAELSRSLIAAMGYSYSNVKANIANIKSDYVSLVADFNNAVALPKDLSFVSRQLFLASTILRDHEGESAAYIVFNKGVRYVFGCNCGNGRVQTNLPDNLIAERRNYSMAIGAELSSIRKEIETICNGATWRPVLRDLRGGMDQSKFLQLPSDVRTCTTFIGYSAEVLDQFHNMDTYPMLPFNISTPFGTGIVLQSLAIGGNAKEEVIQGFEASTGAHNATLPGIDNPGIMIFGKALDSTNTEQEAKLQQVLKDLEITDSAGVTGTKLVGASIYNHYRDFGDGNIMVGTRFKTRFGVDTVDWSFTTGATPFMGVTSETAHVTFGSAVNQQHLHIVYPVCYGTEVITGIRAINSKAVLEDPTVVNNEYYLTAQAAMCEQWNTNPYIEDVFSSCVIDPTVSDSSGLAIVQLAEGVNAYTMLERQSEIFFSRLDWLPLVRYAWYYQDSDDDEVHVGGVRGELDNFTYLEPGLVYRLHSTAIESEFTLAEDLFLKPLS